MHILVIGGTGVISTEIVNRLLELSHDVTVFNRGIRKVRYRGNPRVLTGDKKNREEFYSVLKGQSFDAVIDMISYNPEDAAATLAALENRAGHFVFTSTVAVYKRPFRSIPVPETAEVFDTDIFPYGYHKARMEQYLRERMQDGVPITIIRPSLTYGIGSANIGVMRSNYGIVERIRQKKPLVVFGDGTIPQTFTFAPDLAKAYAGVLGRKECFGETYHACSDDQHIWDDLYYAFGKVVGEEPRLIHISTEMLMAAYPEIFLHVQQEKMYGGICNTSKIRAAVPEFICEYTLEKTIEAICAWYSSDSDARIIDREKDELEDRIAQKYFRCMDIMKG
ncbi:MAG: NAD-dependent epimerase/dehydratase family protein [Spirochaetaceae bacterium]|jgi:nucleoside-diphosphate-sugar epimerase|nr:NAD-dependent epimerase/dehydratase family protein [Spirochaetaceae bacterium]